MTPALAIVVAASDNNVIGVRNELPWRLPDDLRRFKALTMGKPVLMGRKTFESIGKPLPGRTNLVVTRQKNLSIPGCVVASSIAEAIERADAPEVMIIGGAQIYAEVLPAVSTIHLTRVHTVLEGDAHFTVPIAAEWFESSSEYHPCDDRHAYAFTFITLQRQPLTASS